jgi:BTB/POZ domain
MAASEGQTYCLRWNNHKSNLVEILDALIKMESYVDCTIFVDDQVQFKAHRVVLAANSPYFQAILQDVPMDHCSMIFPGVQEFEMRALLEYMYTGEVNVTQSQIPRIMKIAEQLEVKGLFAMTDLKRFDKWEPEPSLSFTPNNNLPPKLAAPSHHHTSPPIISTTNVSSAQSSSASPPYNYKSPYSNIYSRSPIPNMDQRPQWPIPVRHLASQLPGAHQLQSVATASMLSAAYESPDMNPLKRKKLSSMSSMMSSLPRDTPILRNVLAQSNAPDSSQPMSLVRDQDTHSEKDEKECSPLNGSDYSDKVSVR